MAAQTFKGGTSGVKAGSCTVSARAASTLPARRAIAAVATAAPVASKRRRSMFNGKSRLAIMPSCEERRAGASATFTDLSATSPFPGDHRAALSRLVKVPAFVLMQVEYWSREKKEVKPPPLSTEGQITEEAAPPKRP